jgi:hypothetical protein
MKLNLDLIESSIQSFLENIHIIPIENQNEVIAHQLVEAMQDALVINSNDTVTAPAVFIIAMNPSTFSVWQSQLATLDTLASFLVEAASKSGINFASQPILRLEEDASLAAGETLIRCPHIQENLGNTTVLSTTPVKQDQENVDPHPKNAFLLTNDEQVFHLDQAVLNIGRKLENHLAIDDPRISRKHAQLRAIRGHYVLFDLNSTGGTFLNGQRITQVTLKPGDVISLAGISLIYNEDSPDNVERTDEYNER